MTLRNLIPKNMKYMTLGSLVEIMPLFQKTCLPLPLVMMNFLNPVILMKRAIEKNIRKRRKDIIQRIKKARVK